MKRIILLIIVIQFFLLSMVRADYFQRDTVVSKYGKDSIKCLENLSVYSIFIRKEIYDLAYHSWKYVFEECPAASINTYIQGAKMLRHFIDNETNINRKKVLVDSLMLVYDRRINYFGEEGKVIGYKGYDLLRYDATRVETAYRLLTKSINMQGNNTEMAIIQNYMLASLKLYRNKILNKKEVVENYYNALKIIEYNDSTTSSSSKIQKVRSNIHKLFVKSGIRDVEIFESVLIEKLNADLNDLVVLETIISMYENIRSNDSELLMKAFENLYSQKPSAQLAYGITKMKIAFKDFKAASGYYIKAIEQENNTKQKSKYYYELAGLTSAYLNKPELGRNYALESIKLDPDCGKPYVLIGKIYVSFAESYGKNEFDNRTLYWAATDKFQKAKSVDHEMIEESDKLVEQYSVYFPNEEDIFFRGLEIGSVYKLNEWINEETIVRSR